GAGGETCGAADLLELRASSPRNTRLVSDLAGSAMSALDESAVDQERCGDAGAKVEQHPAANSDQLPPPPLGERGRIDIVGDVDGDARECIRESGREIEQLPPRDIRGEVDAGLPHDPGRDRCDAFDARLCTDLASTSDCQVDD